MEPSNHYNSLEHFLGAHEADLVAFMAHAQRLAGGHYARMAPPQRAETAVADVRYLIKALCNDELDSQEIQDTARQADRAGVALDDLTRLVDAMEPQIIPFVEAELQGQPELGADLLRRLRHVNARFRSNVTAVKLDKVIQRMHSTPQPSTHP